MDPDETTRKVESDSEGVKFDEAKLRYDLLPVLPLMELVRVYTLGAQKYADRNWENGLKWSRVYAAAMRHLTAWWAGEEKDPELGTSHLANAAWNLFSLMEYERTHRELDDRTPRNVPLRRKNEGE